MNANLTVQDLFKLILFLLGIGVGIYVILILNNLNKLLKGIRDLADSNTKEIDTTIKQLPGISENINAITKDAKNLLEDLSPEVGGILKNANQISGQVENVTKLVSDATSKVNDTVDVVTDSIAETALAFQYNAKSINDYINIVKEVLEFIKSVWKK